ncbi:TPA: hypothetical protein ACX4EX_001739 [Yersinia enterocolitica]|uniref:hypothetical protein n=1 Tax=Yersinia enterocolitica TaxID=630 RepID=UPI0005FCDE0A|nr:hypothetical protein [Yersinia enterocolitica]EKN5934903.1 hypothetical protein [Yersinia enterocolitica]ELX2273969.1 hypothetical protein [Yersinia enterocolitica]CRE88183.1 flagella biosynthesis regulator [Yersinia enterocolitica]HDL6630387.1 hypothetical protein [Yersinia enterocolitica]HDL6656692.1 hypothetical protein [Yersinia enterocolitica]
MDTEVSGERNKVAGRDFYEENTKINQFIGRDLVNISIPYLPDNDGPLVPTQRQQLSQLINEIIETGHTEEFSIWQKFQAEVGVSGIEEMTVSHYQTAYNYLLALRDRYCEKEVNKSLIHLLLKNTQQESERQQLIRYCQILFGSGRLTELTRLQLQQALLWLDEKKYIETTYSTATAEAFKKRLSWLQLFRYYPIFTGGIFTTGFLIGFIMLIIAN